MDNPNRLYNGESIAVQDELDEQAKKLLETRTRIFGQPATYETSPTGYADENGNPLGTAFSD